MFVRLVRMYLTVFAKDSEPVLQIDTDWNWKTVALKCYIWNVASYILTSLTIKNWQEELETWIKFQESQESFKLS